MKSLPLPLLTDGVEIAQWFKQAMENTLSSLKSGILLIFDEIENISPGTAVSRHWREGLEPIYFWQVIRAFCQTPRKKQLSICLVGTSPYLLEAAKINGIDNPVYLFAQKRFIPSLSFDDTRQMITRLGVFMGLDFSPKAVARLHASYGGHPFFTRQVCSRVHRISSMTRPVQVSLRCVEQAQEEFRAELEGYVGDVIVNLKAYYPEEFRLVRSLVLNEAEELIEYIEEAPELVDHLLGYGLIVSRDGQHEIAFDAIRGAVLKLEPKPEPDGEDTASARWKTLAARRNPIEQAMRVSLFMSAKSIASEEWHLLVKASLTETRLASLSSLEPNYLLARSSSPLYLLDLASLLKDIRLLPYLADRRKVILEAIYAVNGARRDAHASDVSDDDLWQLCSAFDILEAEFLVP